MTYRIHIDNEISGDDAIDAIRYVMESCDNCDDCPIFVSENDRECAYYLAKAVLDADWSGFENCDDGMVPRIYLEEYLY